MEEKELGFYIDKANRAYQEQIWMTAIVVTLNGFILSNIRFFYLLLKIIKRIDLRSLIHKGIKK